MRPSDRARAVSFGRRALFTAFLLAALLALALARELAQVQAPPPDLMWRAGARADIALVPSGDPDTQRTLRAVALLHAGAVPRLLISGAGAGGDSAARLKEVALAAGAPEDRVWVEPTARSTYDNIRASLALLEARGARPRRWVIVTSASHAARAGGVARELAPDVPVRVLTVPGRPTVEGELREAAKLLGYRLLGRVSAW